MKLRNYLLLLTSVCSFAFAETPAAPELVFRGVLDLGSQQSFSLSTSGGSATAWVETGKVFQGFKVLAYDAETHTLTVERDGEQSEVHLAGTRDQAQGVDEGTMDECLADAKKIMDAMKLGEMMDKSLDAQIEAMEAMMQQQMAQSGDTDIDQELIDFQSQAMREMYADIDWDPIKDGMAKAYAEVFTKDELRGVVDFYATPAGQASIEKQPEIQKKTMEVMMPAIMEASQSMQTKIVEFYKTRSEAKQAEATEAAE